MYSRIKAFLILAAAIVALGSLSACQTTNNPSAETVATIINQTSYTLELQRQGEFVGTLATGAYNLRGPSSRDATRSVTLVVLADDGDGEYVGSTYRSFREGTFIVREVTDNILNRPRS